MSGDDITVVTYGALVHRSTQAIRALGKRRDVRADLIDLRSLSPYDWPMIAESVKRTGKLLVVHEESKAWGYGAEIASRAADELFEWLDAPVRRVAALDSFVAYHPTLEDTILPRVADVEAAVDALGLLTGHSNFDGAPLAGARHFCQLRFADWLCHTNADDR